MSTEYSLLRNPFESLEWRDLGESVLVLAKARDKWGGATLVIPKAEWKIDYLSIFVEEETSILSWWGGDEEGTRVELLGKLVAAAGLYPPSTTMVVDEAGRVTTVEKVLACRGQGRRPAKTGGKKD